MPPCLIFSRLHRSIKLVPETCACPAQLKDSTISLCVRMLHPPPLQEVPPLLAYHAPPLRLGMRVPPPDTHHPRNGSSSAWAIAVEPQLSPPSTASSRYTSTPVRASPHLGSGRAQSGVRRGVIATPAWALDHTLSPQTSLARAGATGGHTASDDPSLTSQSPGRRQGLQPDERSPYRAPGTAAHAPTRPVDTGAQRKQQQQKQQQAQVHSQEQHVAAEHIRVQQAQVYSQEQHIATEHIRVQQDERQGLRAAANRARVPRLPLSSALGAKSVGERVPQGHSPDVCNSKQYAEQRDAGVRQSGVAFSPRPLGQAQKSVARAAYAQEQPPEDLSHFDSRQRAAELAVRGARGDMPPPEEISPSVSFGQAADKALTAFTQLPEHEKRLFVLLESPLPSAGTQPLTSRC